MAGKTSKGRKTTRGRTGSTPSVLVLGMHRSGTSALTESLYRMGFAEAQTPMPANFANERGYGESRQVARLADTLLDMADVSWSNPVGDTRLHALDSDAVGRMLDTLLGDEFPADGPFALKDPRISLMAGPWIEAVRRNTGQPPVAMISLRHPDEVAASLAKRDGMGRHQAIYLYCLYMLGAERGSRALRRAVVDYASLLSDPVGTLQRAADTVGINVPDSSSAARDAVASLIEPALRHHRRDGETAAGDGGSGRRDTDTLPGLARAIHDRLQRAAEAGEITKADRAALDRLGKRLASMTALVAPLVADADDARQGLADLRRDMDRIKAAQSADVDKPNMPLQLAQARLQRDEALSEAADLARALRDSEEREAELRSRLSRLDRTGAPEVAAQGSLFEALHRTRQDLQANADAAGRSRPTASAANGKPRAQRRFRALAAAERKALADAIDEAHYREQAAEHGEVVSIEPVLHYLRHGAAMGLSPHPLFDVEHYGRATNGAVADDLPPYADFVLERKGRGVSPHPLFDPDHYLDTNPDVARAGMLAHAHYHSYGWKEDRSPNAWFYPLWYISQNPDVLKGGDPLLQYAALGEAQGYRPHPSFDPDWYRDTYLDGEPGISPLEHYLEQGRAQGLLTQEPPVPIMRRDDDERATLVCVAHSASERIYGSERSFLDVLGSIDRRRYRIVAVLPKPEPAYVALVSDLADVTLSTLRRWWSDTDTVNDATVREFERIIAEQRADAVYANTIMLREPLIAARNFGIPAICHIREAIAFDPDLAEAIGLSPEEIVADVRARSDYLVANSAIMADMYGGGERTHLVYNAVDVAGTLGRARWRGRGTLVAGSLSSNIPKKGIADVVELAEAAQAAGLDVVFKLFGPETDEVRRLQKVVKRKRLENVEFPGYVPDAKLAMAQIDVVLNFSHFAESFGRTIAEGGAAARPAIVYDHGALPEVVEDGVSGVVIPYREPAAALPVLQRFIEDPDTYRAMGEAARERAETLFSRDVLRERINTVFDTIMAQSEDARRAAHAGRTLGASGQAGTIAPVSVIVPNYNYEDYLPERLRSIMEQTRPPAEIIFLDDASPDNSVAVAEAILSAGDIPYTILASDENLGVYKQWLKGLDVATQPWVWIAEADDSAEADFLERLLERADDGINIVYAQSRKIDGEGRVTAADNRAHSNAVSPTRWSRDYTASGTREVLDALAFRNTIPNASAVLLRREAIAGLEARLLDMRYTGDWLLYAHMLRTGGISFVSEPLNHFRRHERSVTRVAGRGEDYLEELARIRLYMAEHFPLRLEDFDRMNRFLDTDYRIEGVKTNSEAAVIAPLQAALRERLAGRHRFAFITTNNGSYYGGSEMLWRETAMALREAGHDVAVLIKRWDPRPDFFDDMEAAGITLLFKGEGGFDTLRSLRPDLTVVSLGDQDEGLEFYPDLQREGLPYVIVNQLTKEARFWPVRTQRTPAVAQGYRGAETAFFTSWNNHRVMEDRLATPLPNGAIHFNPYHIDRDAVPDWPQTDRINIAIPSKLLFIHKGQDILLEVLARPEWRARQDLQFNFYGIGPDEQNIRDIAARDGISNIALRGRVDDISEIWALNQALLMPSRMEGLPIMLVSAMLSARVPIVTDIGGHAEVVSDGDSGFIAADPDPDDVEDALRRALARHEAWPEIGARARQSILAFLPEDPVADFVDKLLSVVSAAK